MSQQTSRPPQAIDSPNRRIVTSLPVPQDAAALAMLARHEPRALGGQPPIVWERAAGHQVFDAHGNAWLDFSSGVLVANTGHAPHSVRAALIDAVQKGQLFSYCFPTEVRAKVVAKLASLAPAALDRVFLLTTGSEAIEAALKLARTYAIRNHGPDKRVIVHFKNAFHGRTMGAQLAAGADGPKEWIGTTSGYAQVPFPDGYWTNEKNFDTFESALTLAGVARKDIAAVIMEPYQGGTVALAPADYMHRLRAWCTAHDVQLIMDEVQSGFGRTGKMFAFQHFGIEPDLICCGKAISGSLPLSAVIGPQRLLDLYGPGEMSSTHGGNPLSCVAAFANLDLLNDDLLAHAVAAERVLRDGLERIRQRHPDRISAVHGVGMVFALMVTKGGKHNPNPSLANAVVQRAFQTGLLLFAPVGPGHGTVKIAPPLITPMDALEEGIQVLADAFDDLAGESQ